MRRARVDRKTTETHVRVRIDLDGRVLVPVFNDPRDRLALGLLAELFPDREVTPIYSGDLIWGLGTIHCMTQQEPSPRGP